MIKKFRAWDGEQYWYANSDWIFTQGYKAYDLRSASFELKDVDQFTGKIAANLVLIYENDLLEDKASKKLYHVIWSDTDCGFRKVPYGFPFPETKIDEAFMEVIGTINSQEK